MIELLYYLAVIIIYIFIATTSLIYLTDHNNWKPYFTKGSKAYINHMPHWFN